MKCFKTSSRVCSVPGIAPARAEGWLRVRVKEQELGRGRGRVRVKYKGRSGEQTDTMAGL